MDTSREKDENAKGIEPSSNSSADGGRGPIRFHKKNVSLFPLNNKPDGDFKLSNGTQSNVSGAKGSSTFFTQAEGENGLHR